MQKIDFIVTEKAGTFVAGRRSPGLGNALPLTEEEAVYALQAGELRRPGTPVQAPIEGQETPAVKKPAKNAGA